jgi:hypothetical protein
MAAADLISYLTLAGGVPTAVRDVGPVALTG